MQLPQILEYSIVKSRKHHFKGEHNIIQNKQQLWLSSRSSKCYYDIYFQSCFLKPRIFKW